MLVTFYAQLCLQLDNINEICISKTRQKLPTLCITACNIRNALNNIVEHCRVGIHQLFIRCSGLTGSHARDNVSCLSCGFIVLFSRILSVGLFVCSLFG